MRCKRMWLISLLVSSLVMVSSAPSEKRKRGIKPSPKKDEMKLKQFLQAESKQIDNTSGDGLQWYPTVDLGSDENDFDYKSDKEAEANQKAKAKTKAKENKNPETKKDAQAGKSNFRTFCEDGSKDENCPQSKSTSKQKSPTANVQITGDDQSLHALLISIRETVDKHDSLDKNEVKGLREQVANLVKRIDELQQKLKDGCGDMDNSHRSTLTSNSKVATGTVPALTGAAGSNDYDPRQHGQIKEIEEQHIVERKIVKSKDHQGAKKVISEEETVEEKGKPMTKTTIKITPTTKRTVMSENGEIKITPISGGQAPVKGAATDNMGQAPRKGAVTDDKFTSTTVDYLKQPADVNFNGGVNRPMDILKKEYPEGHWPDENDDEDVSSNKLEDEDIESDYYEDYGENGDDNSKGKQDFHENDSNLDLTLTPEYLEEIIQQERELMKGSNKVPSAHHVQEHKLNYLSKRNFH